MMTLEDLAGEIAKAHGIDSPDAAMDVVRVHVEQIADDSDLWDADANALTDAGVELITGAVAASYEQGLHGTIAQRLIQEIAEISARIKDAEKVVKNLTADRDELVRSALRTELPRAEIATAAGVKEARLYQIRDGRR